MKNILKAFLLIIASFFMANCSSQKLARENWQRQWMLISFKDFSRDLMIKNRANLDLSATKSPQNQFSANMGCNGMFFTVEFKNNGTVKFSEVGSTMMYCEGNMDLETAFAKSLPTMTKYQIDGHHLTLTNDKGEKMKFVAADWD